MEDPRVADRGLPGDAVLIGEYLLEVDDIELTDRFFLKEPVIKLLFA